MFRENDGSLASLYHCPLVFSPLHTMNQCYNRTPILYDVQIQFVDPITQQTHPTVVLQNCTERTKNLFQFNKDQEDYWYTLKPGLLHLDRPAVFGPKDVSAVAVGSLPGLKDARMYTRNELSSFWDSILISSASRIALKYLAEAHCLFKQQEHAQFPCYAPQTDFFVDNMIWSGYFKIGSWIRLDQLHKFMNTAETLFSYFFSNLL